MLKPKLREGHCLGAHSRGAARTAKGPALEQRLIEAYGKQFARNYQKVAQNHSPDWSPADIFDEAFELTYPGEMAVDVRALGSEKCRSR